MSKLKAYKVGCHYDDHGAVIVFAESSRKVSRRANAVVCDCDFVDVTIHRAPTFDDLADKDGPLMPSDYLARGWYWGCSGCSNERLHESDGPLIVEKRLFCRRECAEKMVADDARIMAMAGGRVHESIVNAHDEVKAWLDANP